MGEGGQYPIRISRRPRVGMVETSQYRSPDHRSDGSWASSQRALQIEAAVRKIAVAVGDELSENGAKVVLVVNDDVIERLRT